MIKETSPKERLNKSRVVNHQLEKLQSQIKAMREQSKSWSVFFTNIPREVSEEDIVDIFSVYGKIVSKSIKKGYGFVKYHSEQSARQAV